MNKHFHALSPERQDGVKRVVAAAREQRKAQAELLHDQSEARAFAPTFMGEVNWELRTDECGTIATGQWPREGRT